jgi:hypothetical protein
VGGHGMSVGGWFVMVKEMATTDDICYRHLLWGYHIADGGNVAPGSRVW